MEKAPVSEIRESGVVCAPDSREFGRPARFLITPLIMQLPGRLRLTTLGDVLGALHRERATGVLELTECDGARAGVTHRLHLVHGLVAEVGAGPPRETSGGSRFSRERRDQQRARLDALFRLKDARVAFHVARERTKASVPPFGPSEFLAGRERLRDRGAPGSGVRKSPLRERALWTLGLTETADAASVQRAFRQLASRWHPDRFPKADADQRAILMRRFAELTAAYHALVS